MNDAFTFMMDSQQENARSKTFLADAKYTDTIPGKIMYLGSNEEEYTKRYVKLKCEDQYELGNKKEEA